MNGFGTMTTNHYEALGVTPSASMEEIKIAYRQLARQYHPDTTSEDPDASIARFREVREAWEWLSEHHVRVVPVTEIVTKNSDEVVGTTLISIDGVNATLVRLQRPWGGEYTELHLEIDQAKLLRGFPEGDHLDMIRVLQYGHEVFSTWPYTFSSFEDALRNYEVKQEVTRYLQELSGYRVRYSKLDNNDRPVANLPQLLREADTAAHRYSFRYGRYRDSQPVRSLLKQIQNELERLEAGGSQLLVDGLLEGSIGHRDTAFNQKVIDQLRSLSVRSNGFIEPLTEQQLRKHYADKIGDVQKLGKLSIIDLKLWIKDYAPQDILDELELAPETVEIQGRRGSSHYTVEYDVIEVEKQSIPVGRVTIPLDVYKRNAHEYGKPSQFSELPYGIRLVVSVTFNGAVIATGFDDDDLARKITKYMKAKSRGNPTGNVGNIFGYTNGPSDVPPWFKGKRIRW